MQERDRAEPLVRTLASTSPSSADYLSKEDNNGALSNVFRRQIR